MNFKVVSMSEIKCRAWDEVAKKMYHGIMVYKDFIAQHATNASGQSTVTVLGSLSGNASHLKPMQYSGEKTKAGQEVWQGDIVNQDIGGVLKTFEVIYKHGMFKCHLGNGREFALVIALENDHTHNCHMEVVGNIHEDKHLLESEKGLDE